MIKLTITYFVLMTSLLLSQENKRSDEELIEVFKKILKTDQSHLRDSNIRHPIFRSNFETIVNIIDDQGFPQLSKYYSSRKQRNIIDDASRVTFVHILQTKPDLLLNEEIIYKFKNQIDKGRMNNVSLSLALNIINYDHVTQRDPNVWSEDVERCFKLALKEWGVVLRDIKN